MRRRIYLQTNFVKVSFYLFLLIVALFTIYATIPLLKPVIIAFIISYLLNPVVEYFERKQVQRLWVILAIYALLIVLIVFLILWVRTAFPTTEEINALQENVVEGLNGLRAYLNKRFDFISWDELFTTLNENISSGSTLTEQLPGLISSLAGMSSLFIIIPFCTFFFLLKGREIKKGLLSFVPNKYFEMVIITIRDVDTIFGNYIRGTLLECFVIGILTAGGFYVIGFPLTIALITGTIAGLANAIPYVGPLFGAVIGVAVHLLELIPQSYEPLFRIKASIVAIIIVVGAVQLLDNVLIKPTVIGKSVNLHPLVVILGVMAGSSLFGFVGMLAAIPVIAIIKVVITTLYKQLKGFQLLSDHLVSVVSREYAD